MTDETRTCSFCGAVMPVDSSVCTNCGRDFDEGPGALLRSRRFSFLRRRRKRRGSPI